MATLSDVDIGHEIGRGRLVRNADLSQLGGACYELRMGNVYYDLTESDQPITLKPGQDVLVKPGHRVVLITHEELEIPNDILARVASKGSLFAIGLSPVATYADPGFSGNMGIVTQNIGDKYILLPQLESIAKADFTRLTRDVAKPYSGQHGFRTAIWPIKHQLQKTHADVVKDPRVKSEKDEGYLLLPISTANVIRRLEFSQRLSFAVLIVVVVFNAIAVFLVGHKVIDNVQALVGNLLATMIVSIVMYYANKRD